MISAMVVAANFNSMDEEGFEVFAVNPYIQSHPSKSIRVKKRIDKEKAENKAKAPAEKAPVAPVEKAPVAPAAKAPVKKVTEAPAKKKVTVAPVKKAPVAPAEKKAPETPAEKKAPVAPAEKKAPEAPAEKAPETPAEKKAPETPAEKKAPETPAEKKAPETPAEKAPETPAEKAPETPAEKAPPAAPAPAEEAPVPEPEEKITGPAPQGDMRFRLAPLVVDREKNRGEMGEWTAEKRDFTIYFEQGKDVIEPDQEKGLDRAISFINDFPDAKIIIEGHAGVNEKPAPDKEPSKELGKEPVKEPAPGKEPVKEPAPGKEPVKEPAPGKEPVKEPAPAEKSAAPVINPVPETTNKTPETVKKLTIRPLVRDPETSETNKGAKDLAKNRAQNISDYISQKTEEDVNPTTRIKIFKINPKKKIDPKLFKSIVVIVPIRKKVEKKASAERVVMAYLKASIDGTS